MDHINWVFKNIGTMVAIILLCWVLIYSTGGPGRDDTDSRETKQRSGLSLYTDYGTGCQYIKAGLFGKTIPRLDKNGKHICIKPESSY